MTGTLWAQAEGRCRDRKGTVQSLVPSWGILAFFIFASWAWGHGGRLSLLEVCARCQSTASGHIQRGALMFPHLMSVEHPENAFVLEAWTSGFQS